MNSLRQERPQLATLTSIRFFAALSVFLFHIQLNWTLHAPLFLTTIISQGAVGMSLFFVLSGFILTYNYHHTSNPALQDYRSFIVKRFARIYPIYVVSGLGFIAIGMFNVRPPHEIIKSFFLVSTNIVLIQGWFPSLFGYWNDGGTWSLSVEAFCYLLFPFLLFCLSKQGLKKLCFLLLASYILTILPSFSALLEPATSFAMVYALPMYRLPEFIVGMIAGLFFINRTHVINHVQLKIILIIFTGCIWLGSMGNKLPFFVGHNVLIVPACASFIYLIATLEKGWIFSLFNNKYLILFGESSYSFYLLQGIPMLTIKKHHDTLISYIPLLKNEWLLAGFIFLLALSLSIVSYIFIEKPFRKKIIAFYYRKQESDYAPKMRTATSVPAPNVCSE